MNSTSPLTRVPARFYSLDALRGLAALAVVFWHWQHFFIVGPHPPDNFDPTRLPLYFLFAPLYRNGLKAVDLFFCLSGFIFFWLYAEKVARREVSARQFTILRFSRLYPLHLATLLLVAAGQWLFHRHYGTYFIYQWNDAYHFALQLMLASNWGLERGYSFNGPIWSVSVEVFCYAVFLLACRSHWRRPWQLALLVVAGFFLPLAGLPFVGRGIFSFFIGGLAFQLFSRLVQREFSARAIRYLVIATGLLWVLVPWCAQHDILHRVYGKTIRIIDLPGRPLEAVVIAFSDRSFELLLFPATIVTLALWETRRDIGQEVRFSG